MTRTLSVLAFELWYKAGIIVLQEIFGVNPGMRQLGGGDAGGLKT